jgi:hypothetical protein
VTDSTLSDGDLDQEAGEALEPSAARVAFAVVAAEGLHYGPQALAASIVAGTSITRYRRLWRMARPTRAGQVIRGRIGFEREGGTAELWDDQAQDFFATRLPEGTTSPFALDLDMHVVAFQLRPGVIRRRTFTGAFEALLNRASTSTRWRVTDLVRHVSWSQWVEDVDRIVELKIRVERPNPRWGGRRRLQRLVEDSGSEVISLAARAPLDSDAGLNVRQGLLAEAIEHADENYGQRTAIGEMTVEGDKRRVSWRERAEGMPLETSLPTDPSTSEVPTTALERVVEGAWTDIPFFDEEALERGAQPPRELEPSGDPTNTADGRGVSSEQRPQAHPDTDEPHEPSPEERQEDPDRSE